MTSSGRAFLAAGALLAASQLFPSSALACKCMMPTPESAKEHAAAVFEGQVTDIQDEPGSGPSGMGKKLVTLSLVRTWKGVEKDEVVKVRTADSSAACGIDFEKGKSFLVYASQGESGLEAGSCGRTKPMSDAAEDLAALGGGVTPVKVEPAPPAADPPKPATTTKTAGCATSTSTSAANALFLAMPAVGLVLSRRRKR
jgi:MYXO-CTERM domain-containing protein